MATTKLQRCDSEGTTMMQLQRQHHDDAMMKATLQWQRRNCDRHEGDTAMVMMKL